MKHSTNQNNRRTFKSIGTMGLLGIMAALNMGNESCSKSAATPRVLRMDVEVGALNAKPVTLPTGEIVDFPYVVNTLFYRQVMNSNHFVIDNPVSVPQASSSNGSALSLKTNEHTRLESKSIHEELVSKRDQDLLKKFSFMNSHGEIHLRTLPDFETLESSTDETSARTLSLKNQPVADSDIPACLYTLPQSKLFGDVLGFEAHYGAGLVIGYNSTGSSLPLDAGFSFDFSRARMDIGLRADDTLSKQVLALGDGVAYENDYKFGIKLNPGIPIGLDFFYKTPLKDVITKALDKGIDDIVNAFIKMRSIKNSWEDVWEGRVLYDEELVNGDTHVAIKAGYRANVLPGDTFLITNQRYVWEGQPCGSKLKYKIGLTTEPVARGTAIEVGDNVTVLKLEILQDIRVQPGAKVVIEKMFNPAPPKTSSQKTTLAKK